MKHLSTDNSYKLSPSLKTTEELKVAGIHNVSPLNMRMSSESHGKSKQPYKVSTLLFIIHNSANSGAEQSSFLLHPLLNNNNK